MAIAKLSKRLREERGQALIIVLILLMIGSLTLPPTLSLIGTSLKSGRVYQDKTDELYAADSGIDDAIWQIKYERLSVMFEDPQYDVYDFDSTWSYNLDELINGLPVNVTINNVWIPSNVTLSGLGLSKTEARDIIESNKLMVAGTTSGESGYKIKINFTPGEGEEDDLLVKSLGIWLPLGFTYVAGSSNLEADPSSENLTVTVTPHFGGQAVVWSYDPYLPFTSLPGINPSDDPMITDITFNYNPSQAGTSPVAIAWMVTDGVSDVPLSWDVDARIYHVTSVSGSTEVEAYAAKCELRKIGAAIAGDYRAIGNSLMVDTNHDWWEIRDQLLTESDAEVSDIPDSADVVSAYLYWSGWFAEGTPQPFFEDDCSDFGNWISGSCWNISDGHFKSHYSSGAESTRYCTLKDSIDLSSYPSGSVQISWDYWEEGSLEGNPPASADALQFQIYNAGGWWPATPITVFSGDLPGPRSYTYTIPADYLTSNFKFRFYLKNFTGSDEYCHVDNFAISELVATADTSVVFKINGTQVSFDAQGNPQTGGEVTAAESQVLENNPGQYSYACRQDVTKLVKTYSDLGDGENHTGNGDYTVGGVDADTGDHWSYAGWSLIIIYSSPETAGHQLYLYDNFVWAQVDDNFDWDNDGEEGGSIKGFYIPEPIGGEQNAATLTCFVAEGDDWRNGDQLVFNGEPLSDGFGTDDVWNSKSIGMSEDGMDIDTFYVTWASGLLEPGDTTAQIDMPNPEDNWNLIYIILSLRSETVTGGTTHYVIRGG